ncbi:hypothetical protein PTSG_11089 [Salpingoeca rosetta]|uniref:J domain-containing protein n=1 Tax=Salpingoeca rosetta (strain ATCC 50818 / BSB-021) TaxID=946362 RepID=F2US39_SALR5|nr:uncharacterized protein PTSG_11089 [Salpingoeca rosetta]EGD80444.1 hypothetical protein PTSG_11089 [Salpingoeca rosetta]|eukprot:XP_004988008.1 hypothetical protein PTSG_11089 [Salpingoeca rosetta]
MSTTLLGDELERVFGTTDLYKLFCVERDASQEDLKKAFRRQALRYHPDKAGSDPEATTKFQLISRAHKFLCSPSRRKSYDRTGVIDDEDLPSDPDFSWEEYWHELFPALTEEDIANFSSSYKGSEEEDEDLKTAYRQHEGDLKAIFSFVPLSDPLSDLDRFRAKIEAWIAAGEVGDYPAFRDKKKEKLLLQQAKKEAKQAAKAKAAAKASATRGKKTKGKSGTRNSGSDGGEDLALMIMRRQQERKKAFADLEHRYTKGKKLQDMPSEDEFARIQAELEANRSKRAKKRTK